MNSRPRSQASPAKYSGVDIDPSAEIVANLGDGLPFSDNFAQVVAALDVLEHTDDIYHSFSELCRVASEHVVVACCRTCMSSSAE